MRRSLLVTLAAFSLAACASLPRTDGGSAAATPIPAPPAWSSEVRDLYDRELRVAGLEQRDFGPDHWWDIATPLLDARRGFRLRDIGQSAEGRPLRHVAWGEGPIPVFLWSQMHGDESTATMALADLFRFLGEHPDHPLVRRLRERTRLHFMPIVNPDGAARFQRRNAQGIDINRDAAALVSPEARALKALHDEIRPRFGFNLHDQRPGYRAGDSDRQVAIALLSPPFNRARDINEVRARAIGVAAAIRVMLEPHIAGHFGRWDDTFNPQAFGDLTTQWGTSTVLIEAGGIDDDPQKQALRRLTFLALVAALDAIANGSHADLPPALYHGIPRNGAVWPDLLLRGGTVVWPRVAAARADVLIDFEQPLAERGGRIGNIGDLRDIRARREIDISGLFVHPAACPATGESAVMPAQPLMPGTPACLRLSRDRAGRDIVWSLLHDVDPARPRPPMPATSP